MHIWDSISRSKSNQTMKFGHLKEIFFFKIHAENEADKLVPDLFLLFKKALHKLEASCMQLSFKILR